MTAKVTTLADALKVATSYWEAKGPSSRMMPTRANVCGLALGLDRELDSLSPIDGTVILTALTEAGLAKGSQASYYAAFLRALKLSGVSTERWPSPPRPPRHVREPISDKDLDALHTWFVASGWQDTADLLTVLRGTGLRVEVEALSWYNWRLRLPPRLELLVKGKGGHSRVIPLGSATYSLMEDKKRMAAMRRRPYSTHLWRWRKGVAALGIESKLPTPHAVRHLYATKAYARSGRNLKAVMLLLGHSDIATTERYIGVDPEELRGAAGADE